MNLYGLDGQPRIGFRAMRPPSRLTETTFDLNQEKEEQKWLAKQRARESTHSPLQKLYYGTDEDRRASVEAHRVALEEQMQVKERETVAEKERELAFEQNLLEVDGAAAWEIYKGHVVRHDFAKLCLETNQAIAAEKRNQAERDRETERELDRRTMVLNPVNWSGTLK